jgi:hypothetical protein
MNYVFISVTIHTSYQGVFMVKKWSKKVNETSDAMDLEKNVFKSRSPKKIAESVSESAEKSKRKKTSPFRSAMSMLNFYVNRAGKNIPAAKKSIINRAKDELRKLYGRPTKGRSHG